MYSSLGPYGRHNKNYTRKELIQLAKDNNFDINFVTSASLRGTRCESSVIPGVEKMVKDKQNKKTFFKRIGRLPRKMFLNLVKLIVYMPLPGMKDKRHYNIFLLLKK